MIQAVILDMDGLMIDSEPIWRRAEKIVFAQVGFDLNDEDMQTTMGLRVDEVVEHWYHKKPWQNMSKKDIEALIVDKVIELIKSDGNPLPGLSQLINFFKEKSLKIAVASSSYSEIIDVVLDKFGIRDNFEVVYSAEHETHGKPHPGVFITTASLLNINPRNCLVFEDSPYGVLAAKAAKMKCVAVPASENYENKYIQIADLVLHSLQDFSELDFSNLNN